MRRDHMRDDLVERERRRVDHPGAFPCVSDHRRRHQRAGIEHDRRAGDEVAAAHCDEIGIAGTGADEVDGHAPLSTFCA
jgi:hypothetical protein